MGLDLEKFPKLKRRIERQLAYENCCSAQSPVPECAVLNEPLAQAPGKGGNSGRISIRITSYRIRLIDPDNLCAKWFVDCLRYCRIIRDDAAKDIEYTISQAKVFEKDQERTEIVIE